MKLNIQKIILGALLIVLALVVAKLIKGPIGLAICVGLAVLGIRIMIKGTRKKE
jgi:hypothetical protein